MLKFVFLLIVTLNIGGCATQSTDKTKAVGSGDSAVESKNKNVPIFQCQHATGDAIISCTSLDCTGFRNISSTECAAISQRLLVHSGAIAQFASSGSSGKASMKVTKQRYADNTEQVLIRT